MAATLCGRLLPKSGWVPLTQNVRHGSKAVTRHRKPLHILKQKLLAVTEYIPPKPRAPPEALVPRRKWTQMEHPLANLLRKDLENVFEENKLIVVVHYNAIHTDDLTRLKLRLKKHDIRIRFFPNQVTRAFLNNSIYCNLLPLVCGKTVLFISKQAKVKEMLQTMKHYPEMVLLGGCVENTLMSYQGIVSYSKLQSIGVIQGQLVSDLTMITSQTHSLLRHHPVHLSALLQQHVKQKEPVDVDDTVGQEAAA
ncbi:hypothetical protein DNTS_002565 [Danionella cerebrum]|uniref:Large ribosomal subunit protein uL10m n=1 Tax=Danionella cerebrum TaxID=2873325 RepID=A0A553Q9D7_9TELE|nr:hypothetical protein DNTS_002565 [Danionella translucida]